MELNPYDPPRLDRATDEVKHQEEIEPLALAISMVSFILAAIVAIATILASQG